MASDFNDFTNRVNRTLLDLIKQKQAAAGGDGGAQQAFQEKAQQLAMQQQKQAGWDAMSDRHMALAEKIEKDRQLQAVFDGDMMPEQYAMQHGGGGGTGAMAALGTGAKAPKAEAVHNALATEYGLLSPLEQRTLPFDKYAEKHRARVQEMTGGGTENTLQERIQAFNTDKRTRDENERINFAINTQRSTSPDGTKHFALGSADALPDSRAIPAVQALDNKTKKPEEKIVKPPTISVAPPPVKKKVTNPNYIMGESNNPPANAAPVTAQPAPNAGLFGNTVAKLPGPEGPYIHKRRIGPTLTPIELLNQRYILGR